MHTLHLSVRTTENGGALRAGAPFLLLLPHKVLWRVVQLVVIAAGIHRDGGVGGKLGAWGEAVHSHRVSTHILLQHEAAKLYLLWTDKTKDALVGTHILGDMKPPNSTSCGQTRQRLHW